MVLGTRPSLKSVKKVKAKISELTGRDQTLLDEAEIVGRINRVLQGWGEYVSQETLATSVSAGDGSGYSEDLDVDGMKLKVTIERA